MKLRGLRIEPQEVAARLAAHPQVKAAAAKVLEQNGQGILAAYYTSDEPLPQGELMRFIGEYLPRYMVPSSIVRLAKLPYTASGKVDENSLPAPRMEEKDDLPHTRREQELLDIFRRILSQPSLGADSDYFLHGGNSLNAMEAIGEIARQTGKSLRISDLYGLPDGAAGGRVFRRSAGGQSGGGFTGKSAAVRQISRFAGSAEYLCAVLPGGNRLCLPHARCVCAFFCAGHFPPAAGVPNAGRSGRSCSARRFTWGRTDCIASWQIG